jgi:predicted nucleic acid-binding protein
MNTLLDTNILTRSAQPGHPMHQRAVDAVDFLRRRGETLHVVPQNFYEFWVVATRPVAQNGMGLSPARARAETDQLKKLFVILDDVPALFPEWEHLVSHYAVSGKNAHDARLVAAMHIHRLGQLLTFNCADFHRFPGITVLSPDQVLQASP